MCLRFTWTPKVSRTAFYFLKGCGLVMGAQSAGRVQGISGCRAKVQGLGVSVFKKRVFSPEYYDQNYLNPKSMQKNSPGLSSGFLI